MKESSHLGLARKYRPQLFEDIVGQEAVSVTLSNAVASKNPAHAYLFFGPKGIGKTTAARILAKALNCRKGPAPKPCGKCPSCEEITGGTSIDVLELDAASHTQVDKIREMIIETVSLAPSRDRYKVFIIDEAHMLSTSSFNALLKTLEEPPGHVVFILATTESAKIPATIVSRCQRFRFRPIARDVTAKYLGRIAKSEKVKVEKEALELLARAAGGALRDAVSLFDQASSYGGGTVTAAGVVELIGALPAELLLAIGEAILEKDAGKLTEQLERVGAEGFDPTEVLRNLRDCMQEAYLYRLGVERELDASWKALADPAEPETFSFILRRINRTLADIRGADSPQLSFELGVYGMIESAYDLREWVRRLEALEGRLASGSVSAAPSSSVRPPARPAASAAANPAAAARKSAPPSGGAKAKKGGAKAAAPPENVWPAVLQRLSASTPALAGCLSGSRLLPADGKEWKLVFKQAFQMERASANKKMIEAELEAAAGKAVRLVLELGSGGKTGRSARQEEKPEAEEAWVDASEADENEDPGIKKILSIMGGRKVEQKRKKS